MALLSLVAIGATLTVPGLADYQLLAGLGLLASLILMAFSFGRRGRDDSTALRNVILIDGSNVMHWKDNKPDIETVCDVIRRLTALGYTPGVVFDANAGYLIVGRYLHDRAFGRLLRLPENRVLVVPKGTPADPFLLETARRFRARIVTNDRYRDWAEAHPEVHRPGHLIRGDYRDGTLWLDLQEASAPGVEAMP